jgi:hypothetical protein
MVGTPPTLHCFIVSSFIGGKGLVVTRFRQNKMHFMYVHFSPKVVFFCSFFLLYWRCVDNMFGFVYVGIISKLETLLKTLTLLSIVKGYFEIVLHLSTCTLLT